MADILAGDNGRQWTEYIVFIKYLHLRSTQYSKLGQSTGSPRHHPAGLAVGPAGISHPGPRSYPVDKDALVTSFILDTFRCVQHQPLLRTEFTNNPIYLDLAAVESLPVARTSLHVTSLNSGLRLVSILRKARDSGALCVKVSTAESYPVTGPAPLPNSRGIALGSDLSSHYGSHT